MMMKKILFIVMTSLWLASCGHQEENLFPSDTEELNMTFNLEAPELVESRSAEDVSHIDQLNYAVYLVENTPIQVEMRTMDNVDFTKGNVSVTIPMIKGYNYKVLFWAQDSDSKVYTLSDKFKLKIDYTKALNNDGKMDAFFARESIVAGEKKGKKVVLERPFAQINLVTPAADWEAMEQEAIIVQSATQVNGIKTLWDIYTDELSETKEEIVLDYADISKENVVLDMDNDGTEEEYKCLSMAYVMATEVSEKHTMKFLLKDKKGKITVKGPVCDVPVKRNGRINLICRLKPENAAYRLFYPDIKAALQGLGNGTFEESANRDGTNAEVAVYVENDVPHIVLLNDLVLDETLAISKDVCIDLNGYQLNSTGGTILEQTGGHLEINGSMTGSGMKLNAIAKQTFGSLINIAGGECFIYGGDYSTYTYGVGTKNEPYAAVTVGQEASLSINNASVKAYDGNGGAVSAIKVDKEAKLTGYNSTMEADSKTGLEAIAVYSYGDVTLTECKVTGKADHTANAAGNDYATTSRGIYAWEGSLTLYDCYVYGMHSGLTASCELLVNGGTYEGYSHGGIYFAAQGKTARIYNAKLRDADLLDGYIDDGKAGTNHAGMYIGGATNMKVYMDNCDIYGYSQPIVMKENAAKSYLYISNSKITLDDSKRNGIRNDSSNFVYFGKGNEFGPEVLDNNRNYEITSNEYNAN